MTGSRESKHLRHVKLRGFERMVTTTDKVSMKIVHSMLVTGDAKTLARYLPEALMRTFNTHPRMRARQVKNQLFTAEILPPVTLSDINHQNLLRVRHFSSTKGSDGAFDAWEHYAEDECNVGFDRYVKIPFFLTAWVDEEATRVRLMLFSDHYMSDGYSGMVVLNCVLEQVTSLAAQEPPIVDKQPLEFPLRPSFYDMWLSKKPLSKTLMKGVISVLGKAIYRSEMKKFHPVLPARADQHDFVVPPVSNLTSASFAQGSPDCMNKALVKCKDEDVTFSGAVVGATLLAFYHAAKELPDFDAGKPFKIMADLDYNMRKRVPCPPEETPVGAYLAFSDLGWLASEGVDVKTTRFWDLARRAKREIDGKLSQTMMLAAVPIIMDQKINAKIQPSFAKALNIRHSQTSDANISNVGRYPYALVHSLANSNKSFLEVKSLHVYNSIPHLGPSAVFYLSSVESFCYAMGHKCEDNAAKSLFTAWVALCENIGNVGADDTLVNVLEHLNL